MALILPFAGKTPRIGRDVEIPLRGRREPRKVAGIPPSEQRHLVAAPQRRPRFEIVHAAGRLAFVGGWAVDRRDGDVVQAEIDAQDRTVVYQMVEDEAPNHRRSRQGEEWGPSLEQRPRLRHLVVLHGRNRLPGCSDVPIK